MASIAHLQSSVRLGVTATAEDIQTLLCVKQYIHTYIHTYIHVYTPLNYT